MAMVVGNERIVEEEERKNKKDGDKSCIAT
jgi:hypothetical protein